ncbi:sigma-70 family RNA polymerase sigma factor [Agriterribacter sp.]|uniref:RNA polymerase sigma factor n=1 Tax=Agriterribacter sp. TaxID=2821509 RepID=UPI002C1A951E|nr:sigma-70 family RNA polymerase sigma factor [Agriterribacter sp.]HTN06574.1 sigma-70 family RNA polymerase sigma factor [Agriterribacter sp.]
MIISRDIAEEVQYWYESFRIHLMNMGLKLGYKQDEINDLINQFFLDLLEKNINPSSIINPQAYLAVAFKRKLIDHYRKTGKNRFIPTENIIDEPVIPSVQETLELAQANTELIDKIRAAYHKLPARCRKVIDLKFYKGLSTEQIMAQTGLSRRTVYNNLFEGVKILRAELNKASPSVRLSALLSLLPLLAGNSIYNYI